MFIFVDIREGKFSFLEGAYGILCFFRVVRAEDLLRIFFLFCWFLRLDNRYVCFFVFKKEVGEGY